MTIPKLVAALLTLFFPLFGLLAQPTNESVLVRAELARKEIQIGDQLYLEVNVSAPAGTEIMALAESAPAEENGVEVLSAGELNVVAESPELLLQQRFLITCFDTGYVAIAPLAYGMKTTNGRPDTVRSNDLLLRVRGIPVTEDNDIIHSKKVLEEPINWLDLWPLYLAVLLAGGAYLGYRRWQDRVAAPPPPPPPPPADFKALRALDQLEEKALWQAGKTKTYYSELTYILRDYLEGRFKVPALEMTTRQITRKLGEHPELTELLQLSDLVKFAKAVPERELHPRSLERVRAFVRKTSAGAATKEEE